MGLAKEIERKIKESRENKEKEKGMSYKEMIEEATKRGLEKKTIDDDSRKLQITILKTYIPDVRFVKLMGPPLEKKPLEEGWTKNTSLTLDNYNPLAKKTYGILGGYNNLFVVDFDSKLIQDKVLVENRELFDTFQVRTALKGLLHCYFYATDTSPIRNVAIKNEIGKTIIDIKGTGGQVLGPGSVIEGRMYTIVNEKEIKKTDYLSMCELLKSYSSKKGEIPPQQTNTPRVDYTEEDIKVHNEISQRLTVLDVLKEHGTNTDRNPGECPFGHPSEHNTCFSYTESKWHCFNCEKSGNALTLFAQLNKISNKEAYVRLKKRYGLKDGYDLKREAKEKDDEEKKEDEKKKMMLYRMLPIKSFTIYKNKDDSTYQLRFEYEEEVIIKMLPSNLLMVNEFRVRYFNETGILLPKIQATSWEKILCEWDQYKEIITEVTGTDEDSVAIDTFLNDLNNYCIVTDERQANASGRVLIIPKEQDTVYVSVSNVSNIVKKNQIKITIGKLRNLLNKHIIGKSKVINVGGKKRVRFWVFKRDMLELDDTPQEEESNETD